MFSRLVFSTLLLTISSAALAEPVCHVKGNGDEIQIDVNINALDAHYAHGDADPLPLYEDADGDGFGNSASTIVTCDDSVDGYVAVGGDLDDTNASVGDLAALEKDYEEVGAESADVEGEEDVEE